jgi:hypothetical protein
LGSKVRIWLITPIKAIRNGLTHALKTPNSVFSAPTQNKTRKATARGTLSAAPLFRTHAPASRTESSLKKNYRAVKHAPDKNGRHQPANGISWRATRDSGRGVARLYKGEAAAPPSRRNRFPQGKKSQPLLTPRSTAPSPSSRPSPSQSPARSLLLPLGDEDDFAGRRSQRGGNHR